MKTNALSDVIGGKIKIGFERVYRGKAPTTKVFPFIVYRLESVVKSYPSNDYYLNVDHYEAPNQSVRTVEQLADNIDAILDELVIIQDGLNIHIERENRQSIDSEDSTTPYVVNIRYVVRVYEQ